MLDMNLKDWRKKRKLSQAALASRIEAYALQKFPDGWKKLKQTTVGSWERGTMPRKYWLKVIRQYTNGRVTSNDFEEAVTLQMVVCGEQPSA